MFQPLENATGNDDQALYFQKLVPTTTFAAGVAVIKGLEGTPVDERTGLSWDHRQDRHCGSGAPRWNINVTVPNVGNQTVILGCFYAQHTPVVGTSNWCHDNFTSLIPTFPHGTTLRNLVIVFDEGTENAVPQPPGCPAGTSDPLEQLLDAPLSTLFP